MRARPGGAATAAPAACASSTTRGDALERRHEDGGVAEAPRRGSSPSSAVRTRTRPRSARGSGGRPPSGRVRSSTSSQSGSAASSRTSARSSGRSVWRHSRTTILRFCAGREELEVDAERARARSGPGSGRPRPPPSPRSSRAARRAGRAGARAARGPAGSRAARARRTSRRSARRASRSARYERLGSPGSKPCTTSKPPAASATARFARTPTGTPMRLRREIGTAGPSATTSASRPSASARRPAARSRGAVRRREHGDAVAARAQLPASPATCSFTSCGCDQAKGVTRATRSAIVALESSDGRQADDRRAAAQRSGLQSRTRPARSRHTATHSVPDRRSTAATLPLTTPTAPGFVSSVLLLPRGRARPERARLRRRRLSTGTLLRDARRRSARRRRGVERPRRLGRDPAVERRWRIAERVDDARSSMTGGRRLDMGDGALHLGRDLVADAVHRRERLVDLAALTWSARSSSRSESAPAAGSAVVEAGGDAHALVLRDRDDAAAQASFSACSRRCALATPASRATTSAKTTIDAIALGARHGLRTHLDDRRDGGDDGATMRRGSARPSWTASASHVSELPHVGDSAAMPRRR